MNSQKRFQGFTLAELLITLAILGVIATFTIPKILVAQQNSTNNAIAKEMAGMVVGAYQQYQSQYSTTSGVGIEDLTQFMNYIAFDTSTLIDAKQNQGTSLCGSGTANYCLKLASGAMLRYGKSSTYNFGGTSATNYVWFDVDPDGKVTDGTTNGPGKSIEFCMFYNNRLSTRDVVSGTNNDPPWFNWSQ